LNQETIEAIHSYVERPRANTKGFVGAIKKVFTALSLPVRYVRGDSTKPDEPMFLVAKKDIEMPNGSTKEQIVVLVGSPSIVKSTERKKLEEFAQNFEKIGVPQMDPIIERKDFAWAFLRGENTFYQASSISINRWFMKLWNWVTSSSYRALAVYGSLKVYDYPLYEDFKSLEILKKQSRGEKELKKINTAGDKGEVLYLLNKHTPNVIESMDRLGSDTRAAVVMLLMFSATNDFLTFLDIGMSHISTYTTLIPAVALVTSRMLAGFSNVMQDGKIPKISRKNLYLLSKKIKELFLVDLLNVLKGEQKDPSRNSEELFEKYKLKIDKDDYWRKAFTALLGHEKVERDGAVVYKTNTIGENLATYVKDQIPNTDAISSEALAVLKALPGFDPNIPVDSIKIVQKRQLDSGATATSEHVLELPILEAQINEPDERKLAPLLILVPGEFMNGVSYQILSKMGFKTVLSSRKPIPGGMTELIVHDE
jgi:hypothetical protein